MSAKKFKFNHSTLTFEPEITSTAKKFANLAIQFVSSLIVAVIVYNVYTYFFDTPKQKTLLRTNAEIALRLELLAKSLDEVNSALTEIQHRDNNTYRAIFEADTIPASLRQGGVGGYSRYQDLMGYRNANLLVGVASRLDQLGWKAYIQSKSFDEVINLAKNKEQMVMSIPAIQPISDKHLTRVSSLFGFRADPFTRQRSFHYGIDLSGPMDAPIYAAGKGKVVVVQYSLVGYGRMVLIDHGFGYKTRYAHLNTIKVKEGDEVVRGEIIGTLGNTGRSTGPHLHYEVHYNNLKINPRNFFGEMPLDVYENMVSNVVNQGGK